MNILFTIPSLETGGAEIFLARLCKELSRRKNIRIFVLDFEKEKREQAVMQRFRDSVHVIDNPFYHRLLRRLIEKTELMSGGVKDHLRNRLYQFFFKHLIAKYGIDLIHSHLYRSDKIIGNLKLPVPAVTTLHGCYNFYDEVASENLYSILDHFLKIIYISENNLAPFSKMKHGDILLKKTRKIYNGIDITPHMKSQPSGSHNPLRLIVVSRCIAEKGWDALIQAVIRLNDKQVLARLDLVGDGEYLPELISKYRDLAYVRFHGMQSDTVEFISGSDICCFPSYYKNESLPNSILEYMREGKPVITNDIGEVRKMVTLGDNICGFIAEPGLGVEGLVNFIKDAINAYLRQPWLLDEHGKLSLQCVQRFSIQKCAAEYIDVYQEICDKKMA